MNIHKKKNLGDSTEEVKGKKIFPKWNMIMILTVIYLIIWTTLVIFYWTVLESHAWYLRMVIYYLILPITSFTISVFIGKEDGSYVYKFMMILFFGFMNMFAEFATLKLSIEFPVRVFSKGLAGPFVMTTLPGIISSSIGILTGIAIEKVIVKRNRNRNIVNVKGF